MQRTEEERQDDATLLALRMKERATSQGTWAASRGENTREPFFFFLAAPGLSCDTQDL